VSARVVAVLTAFDEDDVVARTVKALRSVDGVDEIVVVDDGSSDRTHEEASGAGATVLRTGRNLGKGGALDWALDRVEPTDVYLLTDADLGETAEELGALLEPVVTGALDLAIAVFPPLAGGGFGLVKRMAGALIRHAGDGVEVREPLSGQRAVTRAVLFACRPLAGGFGVETAMTIDATRLGFHVGEIPVPLSHRPTGRTPAGFAHRARQGADILRAALPRLARVR
jgi:glycosyltransferase involved in cell wall biosynthesis